MILQVKNLKTYFNLDGGGIAKAVDGIDFSLSRGKTIAIVGESGCGKSQTAFSIMRLLESNAFHPEGSQILFDGEDLMTKSESQMQKVRGNDVAMIFQEPMNSLNPLFKVGNQLAEPLRLHQKLDKVSINKKAIELLEQVGIPAPESRLDNYPHEMSGGMRQRVMIAMALACKPKLLIADEPTTALDVTIQAQILGLMKSLQKDTGMAIMLITHDMGVVNQMADDVCVMYAGRIAEFGSREDIFSRVRHPYTKRLLESIPNSADVRYRLNVIPGRVPSATEFKENGCRFAPRCVEKIDACDNLSPAKSICDENHEHYAFCHLIDQNKENRQCTVNEKIIRPQKKTSSETIVTVTGLKTYFPVKKGIMQRVVNYVKAVDNVNLEIKRGQTLALVGESGCGKTTAGQSILKLLKEATGNVLFKERNILELPKHDVKKMRQHMQIVFQDPFSSLSPRMKIGEIIAEGLMVHQPKLTRKQRNDKVAQVLELVGVDPKVVTRFPHEFSGGQRQRIAIARAIILEPEFLVLDEPTSALDVSVQAQILNLLEDIQSQKKMTYVFITHDLGVVQYVADYVAVMYLGKIVEYADADTIFSDPKHPYTKTLLDAVPKIGEKQQLFGKIIGDVPSPMNPPKGCHFHPRCPVAIDLCKKVAPDLITHHTAKVACHLVENRVDEKNGDK